MPKRRSKAAFDRAGHAVARASRVEKSGSFAESYLSYLLARASHTVASGFHAKLKTWKLSVPEYRVLLCLAGADGLGVGDLAAMAIMAQPRMTKVLDRMERQGLLGRTPTRATAGACSSISLPRDAPAPRRCWAPPRRTRRACSPPSAPRSAP